MRQMKTRLVMLLLILALMVLHIAAAVPSEDRSVKAETEAAEDQSGDSNASSEEAKNEAIKSEAAKDNQTGTSEEDAVKEEAAADETESEGKAKEAPAEAARENTDQEETPTEEAREETVEEKNPAEAAREESIEEENSAEAAQEETVEEENPAEAAQEETVKEENPAKAPAADTKETESEEKAEEVPAQAAEETSAQEKSVTTPASNAYKEMWIDNSVDSSVTYIYSFIRVIDEATGEWNDITVEFIDEIAVTFSNPRPQAVEDAINDLKNSLEETAKNRGYSNYTITEDIVEKAWDNRTYTVFDRGDAQVIGDPGSLPIDPNGDLTKVYIVDGDYGRKTTYTIYLTETVNHLYDITVNTYGKGTVTVDPESAAEGTRVSVNYKAEQGYMISSALVRNDSVDGSDGQISAVIYGDSSSTQDSMSFKMPASNVTVYVDFVEIPHEHELVKTDKVEATCEEEGTEAYWTCSVCGKMFSDEEGTTEIEEPVKIPATGHVWGEWVVTKEATEDEAGEETRTCKNDPSHKETREIPALEKEQEEEEQEEKEEEKESDTAVEDTGENEVVSPADDADDSDSSDDDSSSSGKSSGKSSSKAKSPKTGDRSDVFFRTLMALAAAAGIPVILQAGRNRKRR